MILLVHILFGAGIGAFVKNAFLAVALAFLSHYFLDLFPHVEYNIKGLKEKQWKFKLQALLKIFVDFCLGFLSIFIFSNHFLPANRQVIIYLCAFLAIVPDGLSVLSYLLPNKLSALHDYFHRKKIHFLKYKKIPIFWRFLSQITIVIISILLLKI